MPKIYVRVNPRSQISKRHRCATEFTNVWKEIDADDATRAALEEDAYLEVSDTPTVLVEVAAAARAGAIDPYPDPFNPVIIDQDPNNPVKSDADEGQGDAAQGSDDTGTASLVAGEENVGANGNSPAQADGETNTGTTEAEIGNETAAAQADTEQPIDQLAEIKGAIAVLNPSVAENWLADGRPSTKAVELILGRPVSAADRDAAWTQILAERSAE